MEETIDINGSIYKLKIHFERRGSSRASVSRNSINIRIPIFMTEPWKTMEITKLKKWAIEKIISNPSRFSSPKKLEYSSGHKLTIAGKEYTILLKEENRTKVFARIYDNIIELRIPEGNKNHIGKIISKLIAKEFLSYTTERTKSLNKIYFQRPIGKITIKNNKSTWGSCAPNGSITFATRLLLSPVDIIDYVIIHELAHLVVRGHSKKFWKTVERACPNFRERRKWLRKNSDFCRF